MQEVEVQEVAVPQVEVPIHGGSQDAQIKGTRENPEKLEKAKAPFTQIINESRFIHMLEGSSWIWKT